MTPARTLPQRPKLETNSKPEGKVEGTLLTSQVKLNSRKVYSQQVGICIDRSTRNFAEDYTTHKITIINEPVRLG
jgi:hypothetical protein